MRNSWKKILGLVLCAVSVSSIALPLASCKEERAIEYNSETDTLTIGVNALRGNFNPFYAKAEGDLAVVQQTQAPFITMGADGFPLATEDEATVARSFEQTTYNAKGEETKNPLDATTTRYEFVIKDEAVFSDGTPITVKDVLFNLYAYLDPAYTGDTPLRDMDIVGLNEYRLQTTAVTDGESAFTASAKARVADIINGISKGDNALATEISEVKEEIKAYLNDAWLDIEGTLGEYSDHRFTDDWQLFYLKQGVIDYQYIGQSKRKEDGKYYTTLDAEKGGQGAQDAHLTSAIQEVATDSKLLVNLMSQYNCGQTVAVEYAKRNHAIDTVYYIMTKDNEALLSALKNEAVLERITNRYTNKTRLEACKKNLVDNKTVVKNISGIEVNPEGQAYRDHNGRALVEPCDVLRITVSGVEPIGIYNFMFPVAPMRYYSDETHVKSSLEDTEHKQDFGVEFASEEFFKEVIGDEDKTALPHGAGAYVVTDAKGNDLAKGKVGFENGTAYLKRNKNFETLGKDLSNSKIKNVRYVAIGTEKRLEAIQAGVIDIGSVPTGAKTLNTAEKLSNVRCIAEGTNAYAYVGINPKYVPEIQVRQAIMRALNRKSALAYYTDVLADIVNRPVGVRSWSDIVDEEGNRVEVYESMAYTRTVSEIQTLVEEAGYRRNVAGKYVKNGKTLNFDFVIPADATEHFAYEMFSDATKWLNENCGFEVKVVCDASVTPNLGGCAVWATERMISAEPDLRDIFHQDHATAYAGGWGYAEILANVGGVYSNEKIALANLTLTIDNARNILDMEERIELYAEAYGYLEQLCIELPICQSQKLVAYSSKKLNAKTFNKETGYYVGAFHRLWEVNFK